MEPILSKLQEGVKYPRFERDATKTINDLVDHITKERGIYSSSIEPNPNEHKVWFNTNDDTLNIYENGKWNPIGRKGGSIGDVTLSGETITGNANINLSLNGFISDVTVKDSYFTDAKYIRMGSGAIIEMTDTSSIKNGNIESSTIKNATLTGTINASGATINNGIFNAANFKGYIYGNDARAVSITLSTGCSVENSTITNCTLTGSINASGATISGATISRGTINSATINSATINNASINEVFINKGYLNSPTISAGNISATISNSTLTDSINASGAIISGGTIKEATISSGSLTGVIKASGASITDVSLVDASINNGTINGATINNATINNPTISGLVLDSLNGGTITNLTIDDGIINNTTINNGTINGATIDGGTISTAIINSATIDNATVSGNMDIASDSSITCAGDKTLLRCEADNFIFMPDGGNIGNETSAFTICGITLTREHFERLQSL